MLSRVCFLLFILKTYSLLASGDFNYHSEPLRSRVEELLPFVDMKSQGMGEPISNRDAWDEFAKSLRAKEVIEKAEVLLTVDWAPWTKEEYLATADLDRSDPTMVDRCAERHYRLTTLTLAECLENKGRFLPYIEVMFRGFVSEEAWNYPFIGWRSRNWEQPIKPIALGSAMTAADISIALYWLRPKLDPVLITEVELALRKFIIDPFHKMVRREFHGPHPYWLTMRSNWNSVCLYGVSAAVLVVPMSKEEKAFLLASIERSIQFFLKGYRYDGFYEEGIDYWSYGYSRFLCVDQMLYLGTNGKISLLDKSHAQLAAYFPKHLEMLPSVYASFGDDNPEELPNLSVLNYINYIFGESFDEDKLGSSSFLGAKYLYIPALYGFPEKRSKITGSLCHIDEKRSIFQSSGFYVFRPGIENNCRLGAFLKFGDNGDFHNHNDLGTFAVAIGEATPITDPGRMVYNNKTFGKDRYTLGVHQSWGHSLPIPGGALQGDGKEFKAVVIEEYLSDKVDLIKADLTQAYDYPNLQKLTREFLYSREEKGKVQITDEAHFETADSFESALITCGKVEQIAPNQFLFTDKGESLIVTINTRGEPFTTDLQFIEEELISGRQAQRLSVTLNNPSNNSLIQISIISK